MSTSINDEKVLNAILNPNTPFEEKDEYLNESKTKYEPNDESIKEAKEFELKEQIGDYHRKQKKELNNKIQGLKKSVPKGDKKKKKEIDTQIEQLENEFTEKCNLELTQLKSNVPKKEIKNEVSLEKSNEVIQEPEPELDQKTEKLSKAQKRRIKKEKDDKEREKLIGLQEIENLKGPAHIELTKIKQKLFKKNLEIKEVSSDGNCMFYAVSDQLEQCLGLNKHFKDLRESTSNYMLKNPNEFQLFLCSEETGDPMSINEYNIYCEKMKDCIAPIWGSMTELKALSEILNVSIEVIQGEGSEILIGSGQNGQSKLVITYHRHMFGSGEHYNSTCLINKKSDDF